MTQLLAGRMEQDTGSRLTSLSPVTERAVIPAAGLASRLAPVSEVVPKALFPIGRHPAIEWVVAEAAASGCREIAVVINRAQSKIERYLCRRCRQAERPCERMPSVGFHLALAGAEVKPHSGIRF